MNHNKTFLVYLFIIFITLFLLVRKTSDVAIILSILVQFLFIYMAMIRLTKNPTKNELVQNEPGKDDSAVPSEELTSMDVDTLESELEALQENMEDGTSQNEANLEEDFDISKFKTDLSFESDVDQVRFGYDRQPTLLSDQQYARNNARKVRAKQYLSVNQLRKLFNSDEFDEKKHLAWYEYNPEMDIKLDAAAARRTN